MELPVEQPTIITMQTKALRACSQCRLARRRCEVSSYSPRCMRCEDRELDCNLETVSPSSTGAGQNYVQEVNPRHGSVNFPATITAHSGSRSPHITNEFSDQTDGSGMGKGSDSAALVDPCDMVFGAQSSRPTLVDQSGAYVGKPHSHGSRTTEAGFYSYVAPSRPRPMGDYLRFQRYPSADTSGRQQSVDPAYHTRASTVHSPNHDDDDRHGLHILRPAPFVPDQAQTWPPNHFNQQAKGSHLSLPQQYYEAHVLHQYRQYGSQEQPEPQNRQQESMEWSDSELWFKLGLSDSR